MKAVLSTKGPCPASGLLVYGKTIPFHEVHLQSLENGIVMGYCPSHLTRWFIGERGMCFDIRQTAQVIERLYKPVKGKKHGETQAQRGDGSVGPDAARP